MSTLMGTGAPEKKLVFDVAMVLMNLTWVAVHVASGNAVGWVILNSVCLGVFLTGVAIDLDMITTELRESREGN